MKQIIKFLLFAILSSIVSFSITINTAKISKLQKLTNTFNSELLFEYPYSCGTGYNRGKNVCREVTEVLEKAGLSLHPSIKSYSRREGFPKEYNGDFNIYINNNGVKEMIATSKEGSPYYQPALEYFSYTYVNKNIDPKTGEREVIEEYPQKNKLLAYVVERAMQIFNLKSMKSS